MLFWQLRPGIFQALVAGDFSKPGIELAVLWTSSLWTCAWHLMQMFLLQPVEWEFKGFLHLHLERQVLHLRPVQFQQQEGLLPCV